MESSLVVYFYQEQLVVDVFSKENPPYVKSALAKLHQEKRKSFFKDCGGIKVVDYYLNEKTHIRMSFWRDELGYKKWNELSTELNIERDLYQKNHKILATLSGPFTANEYL